MYSVTVSDPNFSITAKGDDIDTLVKNLQAAAAALGGQAPAAEDKKEVAALVPAPEPKTRKKKDAPAAPVQTDIEDVTNAPETPAATYDGMVNAVKGVLSKHGMPAVRALLGTFQDASGKPAEQTKAVKPEDWAAVIAAADKKAASE